MTDTTEEVEALDDLVEMYSGEMVDNNLRIYAIQKELGSLKNRNNLHTKKTRIAQKIRFDLHKMRKYAQK